MNRSASTAPPHAVTKSADAELALFLEMRRLEKERNDLLLHNSEQLDTPSGSKPRTAPLFRIASLSPLQNSGVDDFLNSDSEKNDYDWLLTPPTTPLFPSLDTESRRSPIFRNDTPKTRPKALEFRLSNARDLSKNTSLRQPALSSSINSSVPGTCRPSSSGGPTRSSSRPATPNGHSTISASSKPTRSSTPTSQSTLPSKSSAPPRSLMPIRSSTPASRPSLAPPRSATPTRSSTSTSRPSLAPPRSATPTRSSTPTSRSSLAPPQSATPTGSSTPTSRPSLAPAILPRPSTPVRSSIPTSRSSVPAINKPASRPATPTRRPSTALASQVSSIPIRPNPMILKSPVPATPKISASTVSKTSASSARSSPIIKPKSLKPSDIPGFSLNSPANLKTSFPERPSSASRGRPGMPSGHSSSVELAPNARPRRQSCSPSRGRTAAGTVLKGGSVPPPSRQQAGSSDNVNHVVRENKMVEHIVNTRRLAPAKRDNQQPTHNDLPRKFNAGFERALSKKSLDSALRHWDIRRNVPNSLRPLMAKIPASSVCSLRSGSSRGRVGSISDSLGTSSPASSEQSISNMFHIDHSEIEDLVSEKSVRSSPAAPATR